MFTHVLINFGVAVDCLDFQFDWTGNYVQKTRQDFFEVPSAVQSVHSLLLHSIHHLLDENRVVIVVSTLENRKARVVAGTRDGLLLGVRRKNREG